MSDTSHERAKQKIHQFPTKIYQVPAQICLSTNNKPSFLPSLSAAQGQMEKVRQPCPLLLSYDFSQPAARWTSLWYVSRTARQRLAGSPEPGVSHGPHPATRHPHLVLAIDIYLNNIQLWYLSRSFGINVAFYRLQTLTLKFQIWQ